MHLKTTEVYISQVCSTSDIVIDVAMYKVCALELCNGVTCTAAYSHSCIYAQCILHIVFPNVLSRILGFVLGSFLAIPGCSGASNNRVLVLDSCSSFNL